MNCAECRSDGTIQCIACLRERLRETAQILIAAVGADGPMDAEVAARRAVAKLEIADRERQNAFGAHAKLSDLVDFPYVGKWNELVRIISEALAAKEMRAEKAEREIAEVRSAVCADDTETTSEAALHLAQAAEKTGRESAVAERTCAWTRVLPEGLVDNDPLRCMTGCGHRVPLQLPFDCHGDWLFCPYCDGRIVAADGEHVCAPEEGA